MNPSCYQLAHPSVGSVHIKPVFASRLFLTYIRDLYKRYYTQTQGIYNYLKYVTECNVFFRVVPSKHTYMDQIWDPYGYWANMGSATGLHMGPIWGCPDGSHITGPYRLLAFNTNLVSEVYPAYERLNSHKPGKETATNKQ